MLCVRFAGPCYAGKPAPPLRLTDLQGHPVDLEAERGNVVLLNFFSAW